MAKKGTLLCAPAPTPVPVRKSTHLKGYDYTQPGYYFVTVCTYQRQKLFQPWVGAHLCVRPPETEGPVWKWLYETEQKYPGIQIDSSCVMPDHIHAIIAITGAHTGAPLHEIVQWFKTQSTNEYIRQVKQGKLPPFDTHIWQRGYYEHMIRNDADLNATRCYIQNNPLKQPAKE